MYRLIMPCVLNFARCIEGAVVRRLEEQRAGMVAYVKKRTIHFEIRETLNHCINQEKTKT
jgi:hypothetical protein